MLVGLHVFFLSNFSKLMKRRRSRAEIEERRQAAKRRRTQKQVARKSGIVVANGLYAPMATRGYTPNSVEKKAIDLGSTSINVSTSGAVQLLNACVQGTDINNRIGRKIVLKSVFIQGYIFLENAVAPTSPTLVAAQVGRVMLVWDKQANATVAPITAILDSALPESQLRLENRDRFVIIKTKQYSFDPMIYNTTATQSVASLNGTMRNFKWYKKLNHEVIFNSGNAGTIGDIASGALYLVAVGSVAAGAGTDINLRITSRVRFDDP